LLARKEFTPRDKVNAPLSGLEQLGGNLGMAHAEPRLRLAAGLHALADFFHLQNAGNFLDGIRTPEPDMQQRIAGMADSILMKATWATTTKKGTISHVQKLKERSVIAAVDNRKVVIP
jgi:hypothetical protein